MSELVAVAFDSITEAEQVLAELKRLQKEYLIDFEDAVIAVRRPDGEVDLRQSVNLVGISAAGGGLWGSLWGALVGMLFLNPLVGFAIGAAVGAGSGALAGKLNDYGINDDFMRNLSQALKPNTSALFVLIRKVQPEKVLNELSRFRGHVLRSSLSPEQESRLQAALSSASATSGTASGTSSPPMHP